MNCNNCDDQTPINVPSVGIFTTNCAPSSTSDIKQWAYKGVDLPCSGIFSGNNLELVIQRIDSKLCGVLGDFASYNMGCLTQFGSPITTQQGFVESISAFACRLRADFNEFVNLTFEGYKDDVDSRFKAIEVPGVTSTTQGILSTSSIQNTLTIMSASIDNILNVKLNLSTVDWDKCFVVSPAPTSIASGFNVVIDQICSIKGDLEDGGFIMPTFNNVGSCLPGTLTSADTLVDTVNKIKTRVCELPSFDINALTWGCTTKPSSTPTNLQAAIQTILNTTNDYKQNKYTFSSDFIVTPTGGDTCGGKTVTLATASVADRYVATNNADTTPGTLFDKLQAGTNISLDYITTPGKVIVASTGGGADVKVKTESTDPTGGYLEDKIKVVANTSGVSITKSTDLSDHKVALSTTLNGSQLWMFLLEFLDANPSIYEEFCERVTGCLPDCIIPPNVTVIYNTSTTTTTSTTAP